MDYTKEGIMEKLKTFRIFRNKKGQAVMPIIGAVLSAAIGIIVGIIIATSLFSSITAPTNAQASQAFNSTQTYTWTTFNLLPVVLLILGAVAVMSAVYLLQGRRE